MARLDRNGYAKSLFTTENGTCYLCRRNVGQGNTARHEAFYGLSNRKIAKREGLWVNLCPFCHAAAHAKTKYDKELKEEAQMLWENVHRADGLDARTAFMSLFGQNMLND